MATSPPGSPRPSGASHGHYTDAADNFYSQATTVRVVVPILGGRSLALYQPFKHTEAVGEIVLPALPHIKLDSISQPLKHSYINLREELGQIIKKVDLNQKMIMTPEGRQKVMENLKIEIQDAKQKMLDAQKNVDKAMAPDIEKRKFRQFIALCVAAIIIIVALAILYSTSASHPDANAILWGIRGSVVGGLLLTGLVYKLSVRSINERLQPFNKLKETHIKLFKEFVEDKNIIAVMGQNWWNQPPKK